ncbi:glycine cleavage system protein GcvH [Halobacteriovorax vibrionivorans]|uniref:Glycine cleavage system H protein n=1 Tax=Halobacteriovorax vibrionivorans TaxID=2152716 RepID=A0ABY0IJ31_9BACT|nr:MULTISPECIES: glycine cleavage system protein GcvH [Halobacteriovorax]RZF22960.1 glycine cleavage system protein GcvH [Halobacteriovorax vibrionivorans]TGD46897.1 glycine cleavage system protein GcvH [Halobacteriovorax sp. Y22]
MNNIPTELKYTKEHEWVKAEGDIVTVGITDFAQNSLGDIVFVELPEVGQEFSKDDTFGVVESIKSASDLYLPVSGVVTEVNEELPDAPDSLNSDPYDSWMVKVKMTNQDELSDLLSNEDYESLCQE